MRKILVCMSIVMKNLLLDVKRPAMAHTVAAGPRRKCLNAHDSGGNVVNCKCDGWIDAASSA